MLNMLQILNIIQHISGIPQFIKVLNSLKTIHAVKNSQDENDITFILKGKSQGIIHKPQKNIPVFLMYVLTASKH
jgi:hypothetical protein